ncbi:choloylglycine hydrolase family protein [Lapidilactobacillus achengensis]|uniref:Choloylglycine hydrolase family protein n=1 Tax=Lapidilactobacillus achengensis TaxID=2486000 RepID=A0ABW1UNX6_9LACO|nr:choloylglycine hydrolase family protein [Lapidilactobacillus achengensis]
MCTSISYIAENQHIFLGRTMDFGPELKGRPVVTPRNYEWTSQLGEHFHFDYGFIGIGRKLGDYLVADGVNEKGLAMAELYFAGEAEYAQPMSGKAGQLAPHEFIMWVLGKMASIADVRASIDQISLVDAPSALLKVTSPLHFILSDLSGATVVIETKDQSLQIIDDPIKVMANSPDFNWHLTNLRNYLPLNPHSAPNREINGYKLNAFGPGSGTFGLPGGYTSPERFVRASYLLSNIEAADTTEKNVVNLFRILDNVTIPRGVKIKDDGSVDYTQYRSLVDLTTQTLYFQPYDSLQLYEAHLTEDLLNKSEVTELPVGDGLGATELN